ncbi:lipoyl(octanoyl) transferase LipB [Agrococcus sp. SGAir0287]|uniref:lipoyl(octanoyl) transferase LipB n=1 Tax=Agrococcus sp. SGAir0287 TaxID=2070347 RepID=UPI0010CD3AE8|nr:lipoyl(octanoyl) transferase LipB [Agrococcus sp. SGAir0287]QCR18620.1 lipoate-protein ligase B [Agrococcus sp. SGAir0287]
MRVMRLGREVDYQQAWALQRRLHDEVVEGGEDALLLLEHASVLTAGTSTRESDLPLDGSPVVRVDRGGRITWHGPGQLVAYPIVRIGELGVVDWVRRLEQAVIDVLRPLGLDAERVPGRAGVWLRGDGSPLARDAKLAQVGVRVAAGVSMHGVAVNVDPDLSEFARIVPCGITDADVTSIAARLGSAPSVEEVGDAFADALIALGVAAIPAASARPVVAA